jgi:hypothetical protein
MFRSAVGLDCQPRKSCDYLSRLLLAAVFISFSAHSHAASVTSMGTWWGTDGTDGTLRARDIAGNAVGLDNDSAVFLYDTVMNVTWLRNGNAAAGTPFDEASIGDTTDGRIHIAEAKEWADTLAVGGFTDWRLPTTIYEPGGTCHVVGFLGTDCGYNVETQDGTKFNELAHLFQVTLGNPALFDTAGNVRSGTSGVDFGLVNTGAFQDLQSALYWYGTGSALTSQWTFEPHRGFQGTTNIAGLATGHAIAVRSGDVAAVPEPQTVALMLVGLGLLGYRSRWRW